MDHTFSLYVYSMEVVRLSSILYDKLAGFTELGHIHKITDLQ